MKPLRRRFAALSLSLTLTASAVSHAGDSGKAVLAPPPVAPEPWSYCDLFDYVTFYSNSNNPVIQKFAFTGRAQADGAFFYGGDEDYEEMLWRRLRLGFKIQLFEDFTLHSEGGFDANDLDNFYVRLTDTYLGWKPSDAFYLKVGKLSAPFTMDGATSSKNLIRTERSLLSSNLWYPEEYFTGVGASGDLGNWFYTTGFYSSEFAPEFSDFSAGVFGLLSLGYNFGEAWGMDTAAIRADYVYNDEDPDNTGTRNLEQVMSLNGTFEKGKFGLRTDVAGGIGYGSQSDLFALAIMPYYDITDKLQVVTSYNFVTSSADNGVRLDRYEARTLSEPRTDRADEVHEFYAGVNYYFCGHKLKWQNGVEYTYAKDQANDGGAYDGWGFTSGIRLSW